jgi:hypothetical protein
MNILAMLSIITVVTFIATWFNDNVSKADYIADEVQEAQ